VEEVRHNHLLQELETHMEAVDIPVAAGHMEAAEEEDIALVGRMAVVEGGPHTVLEEGLEEGHHIDLVAEEGIDLEGGHHIEVVDSLVGRKVAVAGELRIAVEAAHRIAAAELHTAEEGERHTVVDHKAVEGNDPVGAGHHIAAVPEEHRREVDMP